jgi:hypothetical protein
MSYELLNPSTTLCRKFSRQSWTKALELARLYGWKPKGTQPPREHDFSKLSADWSGTYLTNDGQLVKAEDAFSLAWALERALEKIPDTNRKTDWSSSFWLTNEFPEWLSPEEIAMLEEDLEDGLLDIMGTSPFEFFTGAEKHKLVELIRFCRLGSFMIL